MGTETTPTSQRGRASEAALIVAVVVMFAGTVAVGLALNGLRDGVENNQLSITNILRKVADMTTFHTTVTTPSGMVIDVSVTCREAEPLAGCIARFQAAIAAAKELP